MKTQLIPLESHDDLISVRDRMSWAKTPRILLVWPTSTRIQLRPLDLKVLQRHAASLGAQLGLVTRHRNIRREAQALGIPVFGSTGEAQRRPWPERERRRKRERRRTQASLLLLREQVQARGDAWRSYPVVRIGSFLLGVLAVLALVSLFIPHAQVILTPETQAQSVTLPVQADPSVKSVFITGSIPAREVSMVVEGSQEVQASGYVPIPQTKAKGTVTFRNLTEQPVSIPVGTSLTSTGLPGIRFVTTGSGELPGGLKETIDLPVEAENAGTAGNVGAGAIQAIEGDLGLQVTVTNEEATIGGSNRTTPAANDADIARLREGLLDDLQKKALNEMGNSLASGDELFSDSVKMKQILNESYDPPLGQPGRKVTLSMKVEYTATYASGNDLTQLAGTVLNASLPTGFAPTGKPFTFEPTSPRLTDDAGVTRWTVRVSRQLEKQVEPGRVIPLVQGHSMVVAVSHLQDALALTSEPVIRLTPEWWPWLPLIPFNITVELR